VVATDFVALSAAVAADAHSSVVDFDVRVYYCSLVADNHHAIGVVVAKVDGCNCFRGAVAGDRRCHVVIG